MTETAVADLLGMKPPGGGWHARLLVGLPVAALSAFERNSGLNGPAVRRAVGVPPRTLARKKAAGKASSARSALPAAGSERLFCLARLTALATDLFEGDRAAAAEWLSTPAEVFAGETPLSRSRTTAGARDVEDLIGRLEHGVFS
jgi:putative toxin-antitoxin system antitoxin component (TIGR02293 family)